MAGSNNIIALLGLGLAALVLARNVRADGSDFVPENSLLSVPQDTIKDNSSAIASIDAEINRLRGEIAKGNEFLSSVPAPFQPPSNAERTRLGIRKTLQFPSGTLFKSGVECLGGNCTAEGIRQVQGAINADNARFVRSDAQAQISELSNQISLLEKQKLKL